MPTERDKMLAGEVYDPLDGRMLLACYCIRCGHRCQLDASSDTVEYYRRHGQGFTDEQRVPFVCSYCIRELPAPTTRPGEPEPTIREDDMRIEDPK